MGAQRNPLVERLQETENAFNLEPHFTILEVARTLRIHRKTIYKYIQDGRLRAITVGSEWRIPQSAINAFVGNPILARNRGSIPNMVKHRGKRRLAFSSPALPSSSRIPGISL